MSCDAYHVKLHAILNEELGDYLGIKVHQIILWNDPTGNDYSKLSKKIGFLS